MVGMPIKRHDNPIGTSWQVPGHYLPAAAGSSQQSATVHVKLEHSLVSAELTWSLSQVSRPTLTHVGCVAQMWPNGWFRHVAELDVTSVPSSTAAQAVLSWAFAAVLSAFTAVLYAAWSTDTGRNP